MPMKISHLVAVSGISIAAVAILGATAAAEVVPFEQLILGPECIIERDAQSGVIVSYICPQEPGEPVEPEPPVDPDIPKKEEEIEKPIEGPDGKILAPNTGFERTLPVLYAFGLVGLLLLIAGLARVSERPKK